MKRVKKFEACDNMLEIICRLKKKKTEKISKGKQFVNHIMISLEPAKFSSYNRKDRLNN